jgi:hypothetical protein
MTLCWASTNWRVISRELLYFSLSTAVVMGTTLHNVCVARGRPADALGVTPLSHGEAAPILDTRCYRDDVGQNSSVQIPVHQCRLKY